MSVRLWNFHSFLIEFKSLALKFLVEPDTSWLCWNGSWAGMLGYEGRGQLGSETSQTWATWENVKSLEWGFGTKRLRADTIFFFFFTLRIKRKEKNKGDDVPSHGWRLRVNWWICLRLCYKVFWGQMLHNQDPKTPAIYSMMQTLRDHNCCLGRSLRNTESPPSFPGCYSGGVSYKYLCIEVWIFSTEEGQWSFELIFICISLKC